MHLTLALESDILRATKSSSGGSLSLTETPSEMKCTYTLLLLISLTPLTAQVEITLDSTTVVVEEIYGPGETLSPWDVEWGPDDRLWFTDGPCLMRLDPGTLEADTMYCQPGTFGLGLTFHPQFPFEPYIYMVRDTARYYAHSGGANLVRLLYAPGSDRIVDDSILLFYTHFGEHSGGRLDFDSDGNLLLTTSDYWYVPDTAVNLYPLSGRVLRMHPDGTAPDDNPFPNDSLTWTIGHRNPQGLVIAPNGHIYSSEHGQGEDEINLIIKGQNYGWPAFDGDQCTFLFPDTCNSEVFEYTSPLFVEYNPHSGMMYYDSDRIPEFTGTLLVGSHWPHGVMRYALNKDGSAVTSKRNFFMEDTLSFGRVRDICSDPEGNLYLITNDRENPDFPDSDARIRTVRKANTSVIINATRSHSLQAYPNPFIDRMTITLPSAGRYEVRIVDAMGKVVYNRLVNATDASAIAHVGDLDSGFYCVSVRDASGSVYQARVCCLRR